MQLIERSVKVLLKTGLQARTAAEFVQVANRFSAQIYLAKNHKQINAKSIMGLMSLLIIENDEINLTADGEDARIAIKALTDFLENE